MPQLDLQIFFYSFNIIVFLLFSSFIINKDIISKFISFKKISERKNAHHETFNLTKNKINLKLIINNEQ